MRLYTRTSRRTAISTGPAATVAVLIAVCVLVVAAGLLWLIAFVVFLVALGLHDGAKRIRDARRLLDDRKD